MKKPFSSLPYQQGAYGDQTDGIEKIRRADKIPRKALRQNERQIQKYERHFVGQIVNAVHDKAKALSLETRHGLDGED